MSHGKEMPHLSLERDRFTAFPVRRFANCGIPPPSPHSLLRGERFQSPLGVTWSVPGLRGLLFRRYPGTIREPFFLSGTCDLGSQSPHTMVSQ